jgi:NitT/TauT family transport system substrate-binding protein
MEATIGRLFRAWVRWPASGAFALTLTLLLTASGIERSYAQTTDPTAMTTVKVRLNWLPSGLQAPYYVALAKGYYRDENLDVSLLPGKGSQLAINDVTVGNADLGLAASPNVILSVAAGQPVKSIATPMGVNSYGFFFSKESGISVVNDLHGKTILSTAGTPQAAMLPAVLAANGMTMSDVNVVNVSAEALGSSYIGGAGDAIVTSTVVAAPTILPNRPSTILTLADAGVPAPEYSLVASDKTINSAGGKEMLHKFLQATFRGYQDAIEDPQGAIDITKQQADDLNEASAIKEWKTYIPMLCSASADSHPIGFHVADDWTKAATALANGADITPSANAEDYFTNIFFEGADAVKAPTCPLGSGKQ